MKFGTVALDGKPAVVVVSPEQDVFWPVEELVGRPVRDMLELIEAYDDIRPRLRLNGSGRNWDGVSVLAPLRPRKNVLCVGKNYFEHAHEFSRSGFDSSSSGPADAIPKAPIVFTKASETIIGDGELIRYPHGVSDSVDYEAELGVVIGRSGRGISKADALSHVFGYTIINDVTARDLQSRHKQWFIGKSIDTFCPMGPWLVTADEVDPAALDVKCWVNGELRQEASTSDLIFDVPTLIATLSAGLTLRPGDVIATGTPAGVGIGFDPPKYLSVGDEVAIEITGLGRLSNRVA